MKAVSYYRIKVNAAYYHHFHFVPGFPHLSPVDSFQGDGLEDDITPWNFKI